MDFVKAGGEVSWFPADETLSPPRPDPSTKIWLREVMGVF